MTSPTVRALAKELRILLEKATPGTWTLEYYGKVGSDGLAIHSDADNRVCFMATPGYHSDRIAIAANAKLIAAMRNALPALLDALEQPITAEEVRDTALEEAAQALEARIEPEDMDGWEMEALEEAIDAVRALKSKRDQQS